jgi:hypothetical protein
VFNRTMNGKEYKWKRPDAKGNIKGEMFDQQKK